MTNNKGISPVSMTFLMMAMTVILAAILWALIYGYAEIESEKEYDIISISFEDKKFAVLYDDNNQTKIKILDCIMFENKTYLHSFENKYTLYITLEVGYELITNGVWINETD